MEVLLKSPQTTEKIIVPLPPSTPLSEIQNYIERNPPLPSDLSWDILSPVSNSSFIPTFTRPPVEERRDLRKAILLRTREEYVIPCSAGYRANHSIGWTAIARDSTLMNSDGRTIAGSYRRRQWL